MLSDGPAFPPILTKINAYGEELPDHFQMEWQRIATAPFDRDLELAVIDAQGPHTLVFPCRRVLRVWMRQGQTNQSMCTQHTGAIGTTPSPLFSLALLLERRQLCLFLG